MSGFSARPSDDPAGGRRPGVTNHEIRAGVRWAARAVLLALALSAGAPTRAQDATPPETRAALSEALDRLEATVSGDPLPTRRSAAGASDPASRRPADGLAARLAGARLAPGQSLAVDLSTTWPAAWVYVDVLTPDGRAIHGGRPRRITTSRPATVHIGTDGTGPDASPPGSYRLIVLALDSPVTALSVAPASEPAAEAVERLRRALHATGGIGPRRLALRILPFELCRC